MGLEQTVTFARHDLETGMTFGALIRAYGRLAMLALS